MLKIIGAVLVVLVGATFGIRASERLRQRYKRLYKHYLFIGDTADMMRLGVNITEIYQCEKAKELLSADGYTAKVIEEGLLRDDLHILSEFYSGLGMGELEAGVSRCETYRNIVQKQVEAAESELHGKARLYSMLGVFSGLFIAILLM